MEIFSHPRLFFFEILQSWCYVKNNYNRDERYFFFSQMNKIYHTFSKFKNPIERINKINILCILELQSHIKKTNLGLKIYDHLKLKKSRSKKIKVILNDLEKKIKKLKYWDMYSFTKNFFLNSNDDNNLLSNYLDQLKLNPKTMHIFKHMTPFETNFLKYFSKNTSNRYEFHIFMIESVTEIFGFTVFGSSALPDIKHRLECSSHPDLDLTDPEDDEIEKIIEAVYNSRYEYDNLIQDLMKNQKLEELINCLELIFTKYQDNLEFCKSQSQYPTMQVRQIIFAHLRGYVIDKEFVEDYCVFKIDYIPGNLFKYTFPDFLEFSLLKTKDQISINPNIRATYPDLTLDQIYLNLKNKIITVIPFNFFDFYQTDASCQTYESDYDKIKTKQSLFRSKYKFMLSDVQRIIRYREKIIMYPNIIGSPTLYKYAIWYTYESLFPHINLLIRLKELCIICTEYVGCCQNDHMCTLCNKSTFVNKNTFSEKNKNFMIKWKNNMIFDSSCFKFLLRGDYSMCQKSNVKMSDFNDFMEYYTDLFE